MKSTHGRRSPPASRREVEYTNEFGEWFECLDERDQDGVIARVELLEEAGPGLGRPVVDRVLETCPHEGASCTAWDPGAVRLRPHDLCDVHLEELRAEGLI